MKGVILFTFIIFNFCLFSTTAQTKVFNSTRPQFESPIAINPTNPSYMIGAAINDASTNDFRISYFYTINGGSNWTFNENFSFNSYGVDPMVAFDPDGASYLLYQNTNERAIYLRKSTDEGVTWIPSISTPALKIIQAGGSDRVDRPCLAISPVRNSNGYFDIYVSYALINGSSGISGIALSKSGDGGNIFYSIYDINPPSGYHYLGPFIDVGPDGEVIMTWAKASTTRSAVQSIHANRSVNGGSSFSNQIDINTTQIGLYDGTGYFLKDRRIRADSYPRVVIDKSPAFKSNAYIFWSGRQTSGGTADVLMIKGTISNGQFSWNSTIRVIDESTGEQWMPAINTNLDGILSVVYYTSGSNGNDPVFTYLKNITDGGGSFSSPINVGSVSGFIVPDIYFIGDYHSLTSWYGKAYPVWCEYKTDPVYNARDLFSFNRYPCYCTSFNL